MKFNKINLFVAISSIFILILVVTYSTVNAATLLEDNFTGTTIDTVKWTELDSAGSGGTTGNIKQNDTLTIKGVSGWGQNYIDSKDDFDRATGGLSMNIDVTCGANDSTLGFGYGDPGVLSGGGESYTAYIVARRLYFSRQLSNGNAENITTNFYCTVGTSFNAKIEIGTSTGAYIYIDNSPTALAALTGGTFNNKGFFITGHSGTLSTFDNVVISNSTISAPPTPPTNVLSTIDSTAIILNWTNSAVGVTDYVVEYKLSSSDTWLTFNDGVSTNTTTRVTGLTNGLSYDFRVSGVNSFGTGSPSSVSTATPNSTVSTAPQNLAIPSTTSSNINLSWDSPVSNGGSTITDYKIEYKLSSSGTWLTYVDGVSTATSSTLTGFTSNTMYDFRVKGINANGESTPSGIVSGKIVIATLFEQFSGSTINTQNWTEVDSGGSGGTTGKVTQNNGLTVQGATNTWATKDGMYTARTFDRTNGDVSMELSVTKSQCGVGISTGMGYGDFDFTTQTGSASYILLSNGTAWQLYYWLNGTNQPPNPTLTGITSCTNGVPNTFKLVAKQAGGADVFVNGSPTANASITGGTFTNKPFWIGSGTSANGNTTFNDIVIIEPTTGPEAPISLVATPSNSSINLSWASGGDNGSAITDYVVEYKQSTSGVWLTFNDGVSTNTAATVTGLSNGVTYNFRIKGTNSNGTSNPSSIITSMPVSQSATAPVATGVSISGTQSVGELVSGTYTFLDINGDNESGTTFRWLESDTLNGTYSPISAATNSTFLITSAQSNKYLKFEVTPRSNVSPLVGSSVLSNASSLINTIEYLNQILSTGQSLSVGVASGAPLTTTQPYSNKMLSGGSGGIGTASPLISLVEGGGVETMSSGLANNITLNSPGQSYQSVVSLHGVSGFTYSQLKKGTAAFTKAMTQVTALKNIAVGQGKLSKVIGATSIHGETDNYNNVSGSTYKGYLEEWQSDYETDTKAITGQSGTIPLFIDQMSSFMSSYANDATSEIPIAQLQAAEENVGKIYLVTPKYFFNYSDRHHMYSASYRWLGEYYGKVIKKVAVDGGTWRPLSPDEITRTGNIIYADFHVPAGELAIDTTLVAAHANYGFEYFDNTSSATISSVELLDEDTVKITLSTTPTGSNQRLRYAYTGVVGTNAGAQNSGAAAGNIRDTDPYPSLYGNTLYNWLVHFDKQITVDENGPVISNIQGVENSNSITLTWNTNKQSSTKVEYGLTSSYGLSSSETDTSTRVTSHSKTISSLLPCTTYHFRASSKDRYSNNGSSIDKTYTTLCTANSNVVSESSAPITRTSGGTLTHSSLLITIPTDFVDNSISSLTFHSKELDASNFFSNVVRPQGLSSIGNMVVSLTAVKDALTEVDTFSKPLAIEMSYSDNDVSGVDESSLVIYRYHGSAWYPLDNCSVDTTLNKISCETSQFSDFTLFGTPIVQASTPEAASSRSKSKITYGCNDKKALNYERFSRSKPELCKYKASTSSMTEAEAQIKIKELLTLIEQLRALIKAKSMGNTASPLVTTPSSVWTRNLEVGMEGEDVKALQVYLNNNGFTVSESGEGSKGKETLKFGGGTRAALIKFQQAKNIIPASGYFGPVTRSKMLTH